MNNIDYDMGGSKQKTKYMRSKASIVVAEGYQLLEACKLFVNWRNKGELPILGQVSTIEKVTVQNTASNRYLT